MAYPTAEEIPSSRDIKDCHLELTDRWEWITAMYGLLWPVSLHPQPQVSSTFRSKVDQDREVMEGSSKVRWPGSTHNYTHIPPMGRSEGLHVPCSLALDFFFSVDGKTAYPPVYMERVATLGKLVGLFSGATWGWDQPHLALVEKLTDYTKDNGMSAMAKLPMIPHLPILSTPKLQPVIRLYREGTEDAEIIRGRGDIILRIEHDPNRVDPLALHIRYDKAE